MVHDHFFYFIKDDLIDPNTAFIQNVDNFLFYIYFGYLDSDENYINKERKKLLGELFRKIKEAIMSESIDFGNKNRYIDEKVKKILKEDGKKSAYNLYNLIFDVRRYYENQHIMDKLIENIEDEMFFDKMMNFDEMQVNLNLYCILVNGLDKTKGKKFDKIKEEMQLLIRKLKEMFCEFDKNEIHKERTFIFPLRIHDKYSRQDCYIINNKENMLKYGEEEYGCSFSLNGFYYDVKEMKLCTNKKDKRKKRYYNIVLDYYLENFKEEEEYEL